MIDKKDIIAVARHILRRGRGIPDQRLMHPTRDWFIGVACASALFVGGTVYAAVLFLNESNDTVPVLTADDSIEVYEQELIADVLEQYSERKRRFEGLRADRSNAGQLPQAELESEQDMTITGEGEPTEETTDE